MPRLKFVSNVEGVKSIELTDPVVTLGRGTSNVVCIDDPNISKYQALLTQEDDTYKIYDLYSVNGTWVNGERITMTTLKEGDAVRVGYLELKYEITAVNLGSPLAGTPPPLAPRPRLGFGAKPLAAPMPAPATQPTVMIPPESPAKEEKRGLIRLPGDKTASAPPPPPVPPPVPEPALAPETPATSTEPPPSAAPKKLGFGPPSGQTPKIRLKRE